MSNLVQAGNFQMPAAFAGEVDDDELGAGIASSMVVLKYSRGIFTLTSGGNARSLNNPYVDVVIVKSPATKSKTFFPSYDPNARMRPACWSNNGLTPDPSVENPQSKVCALCPMEQIGSRITDNGKKSKMCSDYKRLALVFADDLLADNIGPMLFRVPAGSLTPLGNYSKYLKTTMGAVSYGVITRISQDPNATYQRFMFETVRPITEEEAQAVIAYRHDARIDRIIAESGDVEDEGDAPIAPAPAPVAAASAAAVKAAPKAPPAIKKTTIGAALKDAPAPKAEAPAPDEFEQSIEDELGDL
jgi:hypothetical protein